MTTALKTKKTAAKKETKKTAAKKETKKTAAKKETKKTAAKKETKTEIKTEPVNLEKIDLTKTEVSEAIVAEGDTVSEVEVTNETEVSEAITSEGDTVSEVEVANETDVSEAIVAEGDTVSEVEVTNETEVSEAVVETAPDDVVEATPVEIVESVPAEAVSVDPATETQNTTESKSLVLVKSIPVITDPKNEEEARIKEEMELKEKITNQMNSMRVIITRSTNGKSQQRVTGKRTYQNQYGHYYGTIGSKIDRLIEIGNFTKKEIEAYAGTKMSKVNSHIAHLRKDKGMNIVFTEKKKVKFADIEKPIAV